jgi:hypothetical protein
MSLYEIDQDNLWLSLDGRCTERVRWRLLYQDSTDDGSFSASFRRIEPQLYVRATKGLWFSAGYYDYEYREPGFGELDYDARGAMAALNVLF